MVKEYPYEEYIMPIKDEIDLFKAAYFSKIPVLMKGPTGCGKTRFVEYMTYSLGQQIFHKPIPLITVACHEDLTASDLVGRFLLKGDETVWVDGPLTKAVKIGAICYLDEIVEARKDTTVLIHTLTDHRRILPSEKQGQIIEANENFLLVISYNPGYQSVLKDLKQSTRQRFVAIDFDYPPRDLECEIIHRESEVSPDIASKLAQLGEKIRNIKSYGLEGGVSTRLLIYAGQLMNQGIDCKRACQIGIASSLTDDLEVQQAIGEVISAIF
jgi:nitric oxide reductase NorQ protein